MLRRLVADKVDEVVEQWFRHIELLGHDFEHGVDVIAFGTAELHDTQQ